MDRLVRRLTLAAALLATPLAAICQATGEQSRGPEALIYAEALNALFAGVEARDRFSIVVSSGSISLEPAYRMFFPSAFEGERLEEDLVWRLPDAKKETIGDFARNSTVPHRVAFPPELLKAQIDVTFASRHDLDAVFKGGYEKAWQRFGERYQGARFLIQLSPIGLDPQGTEAVVYMHRTCPGLCGSGQLILLRRAKDGRWTVHATHQFWVS